MTPRELLTAMRACGAVLAVADRGLRVVTGADRVPAALLDEALIQQAELVAALEAEMAAAQLVADGRDVMHRMETHEKGAAGCQAVNCSLPPSVLPWPVDLGWMTLELWLCHAHGQLISEVSFATGEEAA